MVKFVFSCLTRKLGKIRMLYIIMALYVKFLIHSNRNVANGTLGSPKVFTKGIESNKTDKACALTSLLKKVFVLPFFIKSSTLSINFSTFCQHCQIAEN